MPKVLTDQREAHARVVGDVAAPPLAPAAGAIDRRHLAHMTHDDPALEREVLDLFTTQATILLARMRGTFPAAAAALAHTLNGSARGVGAWQVAAAAEAVEGCAARGCDIAPAIERLASAVQAAQAEIAGLAQG